LRRSIPAARRLAYATELPSGGPWLDAGRYHAILVEASLLAIAVFLLTIMLNVAA
jgi:hypothetical protein